MSKIGNSIFGATSLYTAAYLTTAILIVPCSFSAAIAQDFSDSTYQVPSLPDPAPLAKPLFPPSVATAGKAFLTPALDPSALKARGKYGARCSTLNPCAVVAHQSEKLD
jgi:hypothetical protein